MTGIPRAVWTVVAGEELVDAQRAASDEGGGPPSENTPALLLLHEEGYMGLLLESPRVLAEWTKE